jgi:hypothetical protein
MSPMRALLGWIPEGVQIGCVSLEGVVLDLVDEVYDQLGSLCQAGPHTRSAWRLVECLGARAADLGR